MGEKELSGTRNVSRCVPLRAAAGGADDVTEVDMPTANESLLRVGHVHHPAQPLGVRSTLSK
jgi:hypothetical protein